MSHYFPFSLRFVLYLSSSSLFCLFPTVWVFAISFHCFSPQQQDFRRFISRSFSLSHTFCPFPFTDYQSLGCSSTSVTRFLGCFIRKNCYKDLAKIVQSGHTVFLSLTHKLTFCLLHSRSEMLSRYHKTLTKCK